MYHSILGLRVIKKRKKMLVGYDALIKSLRASRNQLKGLVWFKVGHSVEYAGFVDPRFWGVCACPCPFASLRRFRVQGLGFRVWGFRFRVTVPSKLGGNETLELHRVVSVAGFRFRVRGFRFRVTDFVFRASRFVFRRLTGFGFMV